MCESCRSCRSQSDVARGAAQITLLAARGGSKTQVHTRELPAGSPKEVIGGEDEFRVYITLQNPPTPLRGSHAYRSRRRTVAACA